MSGSQRQSRWPAPSGKPGRGRRRVFLRSFCVGKLPYNRPFGSGVLVRPLRRGMASYRLLIRFLTPLRRVTCAEAAPYTWIILIIIARKRDGSQMSPLWGGLGREGFRRGAEAPIATPRLAGHVRVSKWLRLSAVDLPSGPASGAVTGSGAAVAPKANASERAESRAVCVDASATFDDSRPLRPRETVDCRVSSLCLCLCSCTRHPRLNLFIDALGLSGSPFVICGLNARSKLGDPVGFDCALPRCYG